MDQLASPRPRRTAGQEYLDTVPLRERRQAGAVYTPSHLVEFILHQAAYTEAAAIDSVALIEPACGAGAFLESAVAALARRFRGYGTDITTGAGREQFLSTVSMCLYGVDLDPDACKLARQAVRSRVLSLTPGPLPAKYFERNVIVADFLLAPEVDGLVARLKAPLGFLIGNPPYVSATRINDAQKRRLRGRFQSAGGRLDLYAVFIERALELLPSGGRVAFVTPDKFLVSQSGRGLREHILTMSAVRSVAQFKSHKVFDDAATVPCVTVLERAGSPAPVSVLSCAEKPTASGLVDVVDRTTVDHAILGSAPWYIASPKLDGLAARLREGHPTLASVAVRVSAGPATGRDGLFVFPEGAEPDIEQELLRPAVRGRDVQRFAVKDPKLQVLLPYTYDFAGTPSLIDLNRFPGARRYLRRHRDELEARHCVRVWEKSWFDLHDQPTCDLAKLPKLLVPDVANTNRFAVDTGMFMPLHSVYYVVGKPGVDLNFLAAVLNSNVATFLLRLFSPVVKDGFQRYRQQFLFKLPIPVPTLPEKDEIVRATDSGDFDTVEELVQRLFKVSASEERALRAHLADGPAQ
ncbi:MAG: Eco57I restriction-modification methylase domain-containing protein [Polyangiaceae bacterium]|jgi:adenine-specific DNA-methyltransferase|nr:Eco57I restriction-modification methylase domain-containing protein [Polyangiaceae bacterium]